MASKSAVPGTQASLDELDLRILRVLQADATISMERLAKKVGASKTSSWNRVQRMQQEKVIVRQAIVVDPQRVGLNETFFIAIRTNQHNADWLERFSAIVRETPAILEAHRLAGETDYLLKVLVPSTRAFDEFYKQLVAAIDLYNVTSNLSMEVLKRESALPV